MSLSYGVQYTLKSQRQHRGLAVDRLDALGIRYVRITWVDLTNYTRCHVLPLAHFARILASPRPSITMIRGALGVVGLGVAEGFTSSGEYLYVPDVDSLRICPYAPGHASVMGYYQEKLPIPGADGKPTLNVDLCPRSTLKRILDDARDNAHLEFLVGFEVEFTLLKSTDPVQALDEHEWSGTAGIYAGTLGNTVLEEIADAILEAGIELQMHHPEAGPGQYEVVTGPLPPLQAADALVETREIIFNVASRHGLRATIAPRVFSYSCGAGLHTHISVHSTHPATTNSTLPPSPSSHLSPPEASFLAALLDALPGLSLLTLPMPASYARVVDGIWACGTYVSWGTDVRETPVRLCNAASPGSRNFEVRSVDATANPYIVLASLLGVGTRGVKRGAKLGMGDCSVRLGKSEGGHASLGGWGGPESLEARSPAEMGEEERRAYGITQRLPLTWEEARQVMGSSAVVREVLGNTFVDGYLSVNKRLAEHFDEPPTEEEKLKFLVRNY